MFHNIIMNQILRRKFISNRYRKKKSRPIRIGCKMKEARGFLSGLLQGGDYLLSRFRSTIGVTRFNFSVRNGKRWNPHAFIT